MTPRLLILAEGDGAIEWVAALERNRFTVQRFTAEREILEASGDADLVLVRLSSTQRYLPDVVTRLGRHGNIPVAVIQSRDSWDLANAARCCGVSDYLREPLSTPDLIASLESCLAEPGHFRKKTPPMTLLGGERMVGGSARHA